MTDLRIAPLPDTAPARPDDDAGFGALRTDRGNLPLHRLDVRASITGLVAGIELTQGFRNVFDVPLEATYVFPLPPRAALTRMTMTAADRTVEGVLKERAEARAVYQQAIEAGQRAGIAEEERPDVFTLRVGNILPGEEVTVALALAAPLPVADGEAEFRFPLVVAPRYVPGAPLPGPSVGDGTVPDTDRVPDASRITSPVLLPGFPNPVDLSIEVRVDPAGLPLTGLASSLHTVTEEDGVIRVRPGERVDRDFVLRLAYGDGAGADSLVLVPDAEGDEGTFRLTLLPPALTATARPRDVVLVLDRSGSMRGWKMVAARRAAARIVDTLTSADRFAVLTFDTVVDRPVGLPEGLVPAWDRNRYRAVEHLARTDARGGTEMLQPLREALDLLQANGSGAVDDPARDRVLVLVTDGQVGNEDELLAELAPRLAGVRVHTIGIDRAVNAGLLGRLAALGGGRCELVESEERLDAAMDAVHRRITAPLVRDLTMGTQVLQVQPGSASPTRTPHLFPGVPLVVTGRYRGPAAGAVTTTGTTADGAPWQRTVQAVVAHDPATRAVWARAHLRDLEDGYAVTPVPDLERTIVAVSLRHGVLCRFTAFVAVDSRVVTDGTGPHRVVQPVEQPSGWEAGPMLMEAGGGFAAAAMPLMAAPTAAAPGGGAGGFAVARRMRAGAGPVPGGASSGATSDALEEFSPIPRRPADQLREQLSRELDRLRAAASAPLDQRRQLLDELLARLEALLARPDGSGRPESARLRDLVARLRDTTLPFDDRWTAAVTTLEAVLPGPARRRESFWKR